jgi:hypothetical protein
MLDEREERLRLVVEDVVRRRDRSLDAEVQLGVEPQAVFADTERAKDGSEEDQEEVLLKEERREIPVQDAHGLRLRLQVFGEARPDAAIGQQLDCRTRAEYGRERHQGMIGTWLRAG